MEEINYLAFYSDNLSFANVNSAGHIGSYLSRQREKSDASYKHFKVTIKHQIILQKAKYQVIKFHNYS